MEDIEVEAEEGEARDETVATVRDHVLGCVRQRLLGEREEGGVIGEELRTRDADAVEKGVLACGGE